MSAVQLEAPAGGNVDAQPTPRGRKTVWEKACKVNELEPSWGEAALLRAKQIALFLLGPGEIYAVTHRDPHTDSQVMARGIVGSKGARPTIASPLHKEVYDLGTGECFTDPNLFLETFRTRIVGGFIEVELPA
ncbi:MAG TPA: nitrite reductase small subunit NirD [Microbacteriaceae bacterium]